MSPFLRQTDDCLYVDEEGNHYFSLVEFFEVHRQLPDTPEMRRIVAQEIKSAVPGIVMLEDLEKQN